MMRFSFYFVPLLVLLLLSAAGQARANDAEAEEKDPATTVPADAYDGINHLMALATGKESTVRPERLRAMLAFIQKDKDKPEKISPEKIEGATSAYFETSVKAPLSKIVDYLYNPDFPQYLFLPSVVRLNGWDASGRQENIPKLWDKLAASQEPETAYLVRGSEHEEITPDLSTGAYYRYDSYRALVLLKNANGLYFISATKQKKPSTVGKKGVIIGPDKDWNYFYSGIDGITKTGLGWADSYIYDAFSVCVYYEPEPGKPVTRNVFFKWLRAGWSSLNMVKRSNILEGCRRYATGFKEVIESPRLPEPDKLAEAVRKVRALSDDELKQRLAPYAQALDKLTASNSTLGRKEFVERIQSGALLNNFSREERESILLQEYLKSRLGKPTLANGLALLDGPASPAAQ